MFDDTAFRARLGSMLVIFAAGALILLGIVIMIAAAISGKEAVQSASQLLLSSLLPLFGTWIGTVLAFYYSKENFESASKGTLDLVRTVTQRLRSTHVTDAMMNARDMILLTIPAGAGLGDVTITEIRAKFDQKGKSGQRISRLPVVDTSQACIGLLHRGMWTEMLSSAPQPLDPATARLGVLLNLQNPLREARTYEDTIRNSVAFTSAQATVADAKLAMEQQVDCQDVMVTATGSRAEPLMGWISNVDIGRLSQA